MFFFFCSLGAELDEYWRLKKLMDPNCEPAEVTEMINALRKAGIIHGVSLMGGGGGGFMLVVTKDADQLETVKEAIEARVEPSILSVLTYHTVSIDDTGIVAGVENEPLKRVYSDKEVAEIGIQNFVNVSSKL